MCIPFFADIILHECDIPGPTIFYLGLWTAGYRIKTANEDSSFQWNQTDGNPLPFSYSNWNSKYEPPEPRNPDKHCVSVLPKGEYEWNDVGCECEYCFVCEFAL